MPPQLGAHGQLGHPPSTLALLGSVEELQEVLVRHALKGLSFEVTVVLAAPISDEAYVVLAACPENELVQQASKRNSRFQPNAVHEGRNFCCRFATYVKWIG